MILGFVIIYGLVTAFIGLFSRFNLQDCVERYNYLMTPLWISTMLCYLHITPLILLIGFIFCLLIIAVIYLNPILGFIQKTANDLKSSVSSMNNSSGQQWSQAIDKKYAYYIWSMIITITILCIALVSIVTYTDETKRGLPTEFTIMSLLFKLCPFVLIGSLIGLMIVTFTASTNSYIFLTTGWAIIYAITWLYTIYKLVYATSDSIFYLNTPEFIKFNIGGTLFTGMLACVIAFMDQFIKPFKESEETIKKTEEINNNSMNSSVDSKKPGLVALVTYYCLVLIHGYVFYKKIISDNYLSGFRIREFLYISASILLQLSNPGNFLKASWGSATIFAALMSFFIYLLSYINLHQTFMIPFIVSNVATIASLLGLNVSSFYFAFSFFKSEKTVTSYLFACICILLYLFALLRNYIKLDFGQLVVNIKRYLPHISIVFNKYLMYELAFILIFLYVRTWTKTYYLHNGELLQNKPISLSKQKVFLTPPFQYQYAISCWVYINASSPSTEYIPLLSYGDKPLLAYNSIENVMRITMKSQNKKHVFMGDILKPTLQKWNHIVLNYNNGIFDIFYNGQLMKTNQVVPLNIHESITIGSDKGVRGKMSNIAFFPTSITKKQVVQLYDAFKNKNPPIV
jgi:hypothetical protein